MFVDRAYKKKSTLSLNSSEISMYWNAVGKVLGPRNRILF